MRIQRLILLSFLILVSCQEEKKATSTTSFAPLAAASNSAGSDDFADLKKKDDESCEDKTVEDIEKELKKKAEKAKTQGFSFGSGEPGCDPNAEEAKH